MKDWLEHRYDTQSLSLTGLRLAVLEAWEAVPPEFLQCLAHSMPRRLAKVIENQGGKTRY
ncbi:hypothetical protein L209DRAFT_86003 [Thermothelomyces heterothallicus CBS 203.75]